MGHYFKLNGNAGGAGGNHILRNTDCEYIVGGFAIKEVLNSKNSIDQCSIPESPNEYLVKANLEGRWEGCIEKEESPTGSQRTAEPEVAKVEAAAV